MKLLLLSIFVFILYIPSFAQRVQIDMTKAKVIKHTSTARPKAVIEHQDSTVIPNCGDWTIQPYDSVYCFNVFNNWQTGGGGSRIPYPLNFTIDMMRRVKNPRILIYISTNEVAADNKQLKVKTGTPYQWDLMHTITDNGSIGGQWHRFNLTDTTRFIHIDINGNFPPIASVIVVGEVLDTVAIPAQPASVAFDITKPFGVNTLMGMGYEKLDPAQRNYATEVKRNRIFEYAWDKFADTSDAMTLINSGKGLSIFSDELMGFLENAGVMSWIGFITLTTKKMWNPAVTYTSALVEQKPIHYKHGVGSTVGSNGIYWFDNIGINGIEVAKDPYYYAEAGFAAKKLAAAYGSRSTPMLYIEIGNEQQGSFQFTGRMDADETAAEMSVAYDGHEGTVTYNGQSVGVKNSGTSIKMVMPAMDVYNLDFLEALAFWFYWNRTDQAFAADIINVHSYPTNAQAGKPYGLIPESTEFYLREKMQQFKAFCDRQGLPAWMTEAGYDTNAYDGSTPCSPSTTFMNTPDITGQTIDLSHGNMVARLMLIMRSANVHFDYFWLADQFVNKTRCGTFGTSGLLNLDSEILFSPKYSARPAWYYFQTIDSLITGKNFIRDTLIVSGSDSIRIQKYQSDANEKDFLYAIWSPTGKNASIPNFSFLLDVIGSSSVVELNTTSESGTIINTSKLRTFSLSVSEKPVFVLSNTNITVFRTNSRFIQL